MTVYAKVTRHQAPLSQEFGLSYATKLFGQEVIDQLPRYVRGPKKGQIKAWLHWTKAESGGWHKPHQKSMGGVVRPGLVRAFIAGSMFADEGDALWANWMGRMTSLAGDRCFMSEEGRKAEMARQEEAQKDLARQIERQRIESDFFAQMRALPVPLPAELVPEAERLSREYTAAVAALA